MTLTLLAAVPAGLPATPPDKVAGNTFYLSLAIGSIATIHILTAGLISGAGQFGPMVEIIGWFRRRPDYERLARSISKYFILAFAISSAVPFLFVTVLLTGLAGHFWTVMVRIAFWPLFIELFAFFFEIFAGYLWWYTWDALAGPFKPLHMAIGVILALDSFLQVLMINVVVSFMLTPQPPDDIFRVIVNPTFYEIQIHRFIGNIAYLGFFVAGVAAIRYVRAKTTEDRAFLDWAGSFGLLTGIVFTMMQPFVGYSYAKEVQLASYAAWYKMMFGSLSNVFEAQIATLSGIFLVGVIYFYKRLRSERLPGRRLIGLMVFLTAFAGLVAVLPYHFSWTYDDLAPRGLAKPFWEGGLINPFGAMIPYKVGALISMTGAALIGVYWYLRSARRITWGRAGIGEQRYLVASLVLVMVIIVLMGVIRENSRSPDEIYGQISLQQTPAAEPAAPVAPPTIVGPNLG